jgi:Skp family chaperone for outer membrane proteins
VKRTVGILKGVATLGIAVYLGSQLWAQQPAQPPPAAPPQSAARPLQTRIGLVNMVQVLKEYKKFQVIENPIRTRQGELEKKLEGIRNQVAKMKETYGKSDTPQATRDQIEKDLRQKQMEYQIAEEDAKKELAKMQGEATVQIYKEVKDAVDRFALTYGYEAVFFYNDAITPVDMMHPANVQRKLMQPACLMPLYFNPGMDISKHIVDNLNTAYQAAGGPPAAAPVTPPPAAPPH